MTKCRKLSMTECEYFVAGGCVSPFNCSYKADESITTATSTPCNLYPLETDKDKEISRLQSENAELRARLEKAVELPCVKLVKTKVEINRIGIVNMIWEWAVVYIDKQGDLVVEPCRSKTAAEARLAEMNS